MAAVTEIKADGFTYRSVQPSDEPRLAEIASVTYGGRDYILEALRQWLADPGKYTARCLAHPGSGELAAVEALAKVDGGTTFWVEGLRTHPEWRRRGLARHLQRLLVAHAEREAASSGSVLKRLRYTTRSDNIASLRLAEACGMRVVETWGFGFKRGVGALETAVAAIIDEEGGDKQQPEGEGAARTATSSAALRQVAAAEAANLLCWSGDRDAAMPADALRSGPLKRLMIDWKVFQLGAQAREALTTLEGHGAVFVVGDGAASVGKLRPDAASASWCVTVHANSCAAAARRHLLWHLAHAREAGIDAVMLFFDGALRPELAELRSVEDVFPGADSCVLVERDFSSE